MVLVREHPFLEAPTNNNHDMHEHSLTCTMLDNVLETRFIIRPGSSQEDIHKKTKDIYSLPPMSMDVPHELRS